MPTDAEPTEDEVEAVVEEFGGDLKAAIRALLCDLAVLAADFGAAVSWGYVRGEMSPGADMTKPGPRTRPEKNTSPELTRKR